MEQSCLLRGKALGRRKDSVGQNMDGSRGNSGVTMDRNKGNSGVTMDRNKGSVGANMDKIGRIATDGN